MVTPYSEKQETTFLTLSCYNLTNFPRIYKRFSSESIPDMTTLVLFKSVNFVTGLAFLLTGKVVIHPYWSRTILIYACFPGIILISVSFHFKKYPRLIK